MNREEAIKALQFVVESAIFDDRRDDMKMGKVSEYTQRKIDAWQYVKENLK